MKTFKDLLRESTIIALAIEAIIDEGKQKVIKVVKDSNGHFKKKKTFTCTGDGEKYSPSKGNCVHISGAEKLDRMKGAKKRARTLNKQSDSKKERNREIRAKATVRFGLGK